MVKRIEKIVARDFKGAAGTLELELDKTKPIVMIFGENGTGKSTIVDAIDFVCNEGFGSLSDHRSVGNSPAEFMPTLGHPAEQLEASITVSGETWVGKIGKGSKPSTAGPPNRPNVKVLRRSKILEIINAQPSGRYDAIRSFIEVRACEDNESTLREAQKRAEKKYEESTRSLEEARDALEKLWEKEGKPEGDYLAWGKRLAAKDQTLLDAELTDHKAVIDAIQKTLEWRSTVVSSREEVHAISVKVRETTDAYEKSKKKFVGDIDSLIQVLEDAQEFFEDNEKSEKCPVCEQTIVPDKLVRRIAERLGTMNEQVELRGSVQKYSKALEGKQILFSIQQKGFRDSAISLRGVLQKSKVPEVVDLRLKHSAYTNLADSEVSVDAEALKQAQDIATKAAGINKSVSAKREEVQNEKSQLNSIKNYVDIISNKTSIAAQDKIVLAALEAMLKIVEAERKKFVDEILKNIGGEVDRLYNKLHPGEGIGKINWYLKPNFQSSLEIKGQFQGATDVPPQGYYSESHLDTLGVCIFLALAKRNADENFIVVLDDIVTSVDQVHMERFYRMVNDEGDNFNQIIITTHFRPWRDKYRYYSGAGAKVQLIELQDWSLAKGVRHTKTKFSVDELNEAVKATSFDRQAVASKGGILLEGLLDRLTLQFKTKMARKGEAEYTLAEYAASFSRDLKKLLRVETKKADGSFGAMDVSAKIVASVDQGWVRNQVGAHFNVAGMSISDSEVKDFGQRVVDLASRLVCGECGEFASRNRSGSCWECKCGNLRLFPLMEPN